MRQAIYDADKEGNNDEDEIENLEAIVGGASTIVTARERLEDIDRTRQMLSDVNEHINILCEEIVYHAPVKIFGVLKVNHVNIAKMGIVITSCLFTFGMRMSLESMGIL